MLVNPSPYGLGYPRPYGDRVTNIRGRGMLIRGGLIEESLSHWGGGGGGLIREGALFGGNTVYYIFGYTGCPIKNAIHFRWPKSIDFRLLPKLTFGVIENIYNYHPLIITTLLIICHAFAETIGFIFNGHFE